MNYVVYFYLIIFLIIIFESYKKDFSKGYFMSLVTMTLIMPSSVYLFASPLKYGTICTFICIYFILQKSIIRKNKYDKDLLVVFSIYLLLIAITILGGKMPISVQFFSMIKWLLLHFLFAFTGWYALSSIDVNYKFNKFLCAVIILVCCYGIFEYVSQSNIYMKFLKSAIDISVVDEFAGERGIIKGRISGMLGHPLNWGQSLLIILGYLTFINRQKISKTVFLITIVLLVLNIVFTGSRSSIFPLAIIMLGFFEENIKKHWKLLILISPFLIYVLSGISLSRDLSDTFNNFFMFWSSNGGIDSTMGGSSLDYRSEQLAIVIRTISKSSLFGMGFGFMDTDEYYRLQTWLNGTESIILTQLLEHGIIGVLSFLFLMLSLLLIHEKTYKAVFGKWRLSILCYHIGYLLSLIFTGDRSSFMLYLSLTIIHMRYLQIIKLRFQS